MFCRICDSASLTPVLDLGMHPWGNHFLTESQLGSEPFYPLKVLVCDRCSAAQLDYTVKKEVMFANHTYLSGITKSLTAHFTQLACSVTNRFFKDQEKKSILDIGSNDGTQLQAYQELGYDVLGVESARGIAQIAIEKGVPTLPAFYNLTTADQIGRSFDLINASGVFFHLEELHSVCEAIRKYLKPNGVFIVQFLYMRSILENIAFDQIYHEHLLYYTIKTLNTLLKRHGLSLFDAEFSAIHGGSIIGYISHAEKRSPSDRLQELQKEELLSGCNDIQAYKTFARKVEYLKQENLNFLTERRAAGKRIFGMGAPVKGNTLLNYFGIRNNLLECLVEKNKLRKNLFSPGTHLPIRMEDEVDPPDVYYVLAWNFRQEILKNNRELIKRGVEFYFPVQPTVLLCTS